MLSSESRPHPVLSAIWVVNSRSVVSPSCVVFPYHSGTSEQRPLSTADLQVLRWQVVVIRYGLFTWDMLFFFQMPLLFDTPLLATRLIVS
jgi:hypothetical protein